MEEITTKLDTLKKKFPDDETVSKNLPEWEKQAKIAVITKNLQDNDAIKLIITQYRKEMADLQKTLMTEATLFKDEDGMQLGLLIHERIKWYKRFLNIFTAAETKVKGMNAFLDNQLED